MLKVIPRETQDDLLRIANYWFAQKSIRSTSVEFSACDFHNPLSSGWGQNMMDPYFGPGSRTTFMDRVHGSPVMDWVHGHRDIKTNEKWIKTKIVQKILIRFDKLSADSSDCSQIFSCAYMKYNLLVNARLQDCYNSEVFINKGGIMHSSTKTCIILRKTSWSLEFIAFRAIMTETNRNSPLLM